LQELKFSLIVVQQNGQPSEGDEPVAIAQDLLHPAPVDLAIEP
jgi:hypothetical protein